MNYTGTGNGEKYLPAATDYVALFHLCSGINEHWHRARWSTHFEAFSSASTATIKAFTSPPSPPHRRYIHAQTFRISLCTWTPTLFPSFLSASLCPVRTGYTRNGVAVPQSSVDNEGKGRKKERVPPLETLRAIHLPRVPLYTFPPSPPPAHARTPVNSFTPFGYVFRTLGSLSESALTLLRHPASYASFSSLGDFVCVRARVSVTRASGPPPSSLLSPCARFHPFLSLSLSRIPRVSTEVPYVEMGGKALEFFARILLFRKAFDGVSGSRVIRAI